MLKNVVGGAKEQSNQRSDQAALINQLEARVAELENQLKEQTAIPSPRTGATSRPANRTAIGAPTSKPSSSPKSTSSPAYGVCPKGGFHVPGTIDSKGKLHCAKCGQFM